MILSAAAAALRGADRHRQKLRGRQQSTKHIFANVLRFRSNRDPIHQQRVTRQCFDTVGWVIWPVKTSSPKWPKLCRVGRQTLLNQPTRQGSYVDLFRNTRLERKAYIPRWGGEEYGGLAQMSSPLMHLQWPLAASVNDEPWTVSHNMLQYIHISPWKHTNNLTCTLYANRPAAVSSIQLNVYSGGAYDSKPALKHQWYSPSSSSLSSSS